MNWPYIHTLVNHFPIILTVVGSAVLVLALITNRRGIWLYALATLTLSGLSIYPALFTGDRASHALRDTWYVVHSMVEAHDQAAGFALWSVLAMGAVSAYLWWRMLRRTEELVPPVWMRTVLAVVTVFALSIVIRTAYLGGQIVHGSPKLEGPAPVGVSGPVVTPVTPVTPP